MSEKKVPWVLKNTKTGEYSDGKYGWTMDLSKAVRFLCVEAPKSHDHVGFVRLDEVK